MFSSDKNIETIGQLIADLHQHVDLRLEYFKVDAVSKLSKLLTAVALSIIIFMFGALALWFVSMMAAAALGEWLHHEAAGYAIVVACYLAMACLIFVRRKQWIEVPITHFLAQLFLGEPSQPEEPEAHDEEDAAL